MKRRFLTLLGASLAAATKPNIAWSASVETANVEFSSAQTGGILVVAPVVIGRIDSQATSVVLTGTLQAVGNATDEYVETQSEVAFTRTLDVTGETSTHITEFELNPAPWVDYVLSLSISIPGTNESAQTDGVVVVYDSVTGGVTAKTPEQWIYEENIRIIKEQEDDPPRQIPQEEPSDLGEEPDMPDDDGSKPEEGIPKDGGGGGDGGGEGDGGGGVDGGEGGGGGGGNGGGDGGGGGAGGCGCGGGAAHGGGGHGGHEGKGGLGGGYGKGKGGGCGCGCGCGCGGGKGTTCPKPKPKPPCNKDNKDRLHPRQVSISPAIVNAKLTFVGWNSAIQDLRLLRVTAWGRVYDGDGNFVERVDAVQTTDIRGNGQFRFDLRTGHYIVVYQLVVRLEGKKYVVGTKASDEATLRRSTAAMALSQNPWRVSAGETKSYTNNFVRHKKLDGIVVADAFQRITDYVRLNIVGSASFAKIDIRFPNGDGAFFDRGNVYINIPADDAYDPDVYAHEYGHFLHWTARSRGTLPTMGLSHSACDSPNVALALSEGFATAFGLIALDGTPLANPKYGQYTDRADDGTFTSNRNYEVYQCDQQALETDEGRITAAIFDLADRRVDALRTESDDFAQILPGFQSSDIDIKFSPRTLFWRALRRNPQNMSQYWGALRPLLSVNGQEKAWNVLAYNWAPETMRNAAGP